MKGYDEVYIDKLKLELEKENNERNSKGELEKYSTTQLKQELRRRKGRKK